MVSRLILMLLCACLALPAMATVPCHDRSATMPAMEAGMPMAHHAPAPTPAPDSERKAIAVHACMGCIPPASLLRAAFVVPAPVTVVQPVGPGMRFDAGRETPPATPPPRG